MIRPKSQIILNTAILTNYIFGLDWKSQIEANHYWFFLFVNVKYRNVKHIKKLTKNLKC